MYLFKICHKDGIHLIKDVKKVRSSIELTTATNEVLHIIAVTDETYTVYDDRFAGASKQLTSVEAFDIDSSFRSLDFDQMRELFRTAFSALLKRLTQAVDENNIINLDEIRHEISNDIHGIYFEIVYHTQTYI